MLATFVEECMSLPGYEYQSEYARKYVDQGRKEMLITAIEALTEVLGIELSAEQRDTLEKAGVERLKEIHEALCTSRQWPAD
jgi:hypothetical protein